jgi:hypothetical protein
LQGAAQPDDAFLTRYCARVLEAIETMASWMTRA